MNFTVVNTTDGCHSYTCPERSMSTAVYVLLYVCAAAVVLLTVCGNLLVIISVCHFKQLHTPTNMLILSLAVSDFMVGAFAMPTALIWMIESCWIFTGVFCASYHSIAYFITSLSIYNIALIAIDRYFALSSPFYYAEAVSASTMSIVVLCDWCVWLPYNIALQYFNGDFTTALLCPKDCSFLLGEVWSLVDLLLTFVFPCAVIIIFYALVFVIARKHATAIRELNIHTRTKATKKATDSLKSERKAAKVLGILVSVFLACLFPYFICSLLGNTVEMDAESFKKVLILLYFNSSLNPVIYALFYPWFRRCIKLILNLQIFKTDSALINIL